MNTAYRSILLAAVLIPAVRTAGAAGPDYAVKPWSELSSRELTPLGKIVLKVGGDAWTHAESPHFIFHTTTTNGLGILVGEAEYAYQKVSWYLGTAPAAKGHLFVIDRPEIWRQVQRRADPSKYGLAMQLQNDIFVLQEENWMSRVVRVPHEVVHFRMWQLYGDRTPIWLDEGLAACLGWRVAWWYRKSQGREVVRTLPAVDAKYLLTLDRLIAQRRYPDARGMGLGFYRQSEELVCAIAERLGYDRMGDFVRAIAGERLYWKDVLRERFNYTDADLLKLEETVKSRSQEERN
jgi:hypothetical protein